MHNEVVMDPITQAQLRIRSMLSDMADDYLYESGVPDDPPEVNWGQLADDICRVIDELRVEVEAHGN